MDFFNRLLNGARLSVSKSSPPNPQQRLQKFRRCYDQIRQTYDQTPLLQVDTTAAETIRINLKKLTTLLEDESRTSQPHPCLQYTAHTAAYQVIARIGAVAQNESVIREAVAFFTALVDSSEAGAGDGILGESFIANRKFSRSLMMFVERTCGSGNLFVGEETECEIIEMLFTIAAKIRLHPNLLRCWFQASTKAGGKDSNNKRSSFIGLTYKDDFPLCYQLIDHIHHEGRIGDFSRTALLYIFETASKSAGLEKWIVESDLSTLMASGLGALYSQLSRKLSILHPEENIPVVLQLSDYSNPEFSISESSKEAESFHSENLQANLNTFLSYLTFWQDILEHCSSIDVKQTLLDHFQVLFLQQLLYPTILESSDSDGGSSVAVLTYLRRVFEVIHHPDFVQLLMQYLLALPESSTASQSLEASVISLHAMKKRKSLVLLSASMIEDNNGDNEDETGPSLFSLVDLIQNSLRSQSTQTVIAAYKLLIVLLDKHHPYAVGTLLRSEKVTNDKSQRTYGALNAELEKYISIAENITVKSGLDDAYESHLKDVQINIELHCCSSNLLTLESLGISIDANPFDLSIIHPKQFLPNHSIQHGDRLFNHLLISLESFLYNHVEVNLNLTKSILILASCPKLRLENWIALNPHHYQFSEQFSDSNDAGSIIDQINVARRIPSWENDNSPTMLKIFERLKSQIEILQSIIPSINQLVKTRKQAFKMHDEITEAMISQPPTSPLPSSPGSPTLPSSPTSTSIEQESHSTPGKQSIPQMIFSGITTPSKSRSGSPRGRTSSRLESEPISSSPSKQMPYRNVMSLATKNSPARSSPSTSTSVPNTSTTIQSPQPTKPFVVGHTPEDLLKDIIEGANSELLARKITFPLQEKIETDNDLNESDESKIFTVSLSHVLTNIVILQDFILELAAILQVRASLFSEIKFLDQVETLSPSVTKTAL